MIAKTFIFVFISIFILNFSAAFSQDLSMNLVLACDNGDFEKVKSLINGGAGINSRFPGSNVTPVIQAAAKGHYDIVNYLISKGADVNLKAIWDQTALMMSCRFGHIRVTRLLLKNNAKVNDKDTNGMRPLSFAVYFGHYIISKLLISKGANINIKDNYGNTLFFAAKKKKYAAIEKLLKGLNKNINAEDAVSLSAENVLQKGKLYRIKVEFLGVLRTQSSFWVIFKDAKSKKRLTLGGISRDLYSSLHKLQRIKYYLITFKLFFNSSKNVIGSFEDADVI